MAKPRERAKPRTRPRTRLRTRPRTGRSASLEQSVFLNILQTADQLAGRFEDHFRKVDLTGTQFNVLRILRGARPEALSCGEIAGRMLTRDPDVTRLVDRLERGGLVERTRERPDRRVITVRITRAGLGLLAALDQPVVDRHRELMAGVPRGHLRQLSDLLDEVRQSAAASDGDAAKT